MRRLLLLLGVASSCAFAQNRFPPINLYSGDPTGNVCSGNLIQQSSTTGLIYTCQSGVMAQGGSSAAGTISGQTVTCLPKASGASALTSASAVCDNGATVTAAEPITAPSFAGAGTGLTGTAASLTAGHANNLPADFATQSAATPAGGTFSTVAAGTAVLTGARDARSIYAANITTPCMDQTGNLTYVDSSACLLGTTITQDATNTYNVASHVSYLSAQGGIYNYNGSSGTKSNRIAAFVTGAFNTVSQSWGLNSVLTCFGGGECIPLNSYTTVYGGFQSNGQEADEGLRVQQQQGSDTDSVGGVWNGTVTAINAGVVSFTVNNNAGDLGEGGSRFIRDLGTTYSTGTIASVVCAGSSPTTCTITGSGTTWTSISGFVGTHTTWNNVATAGNILTTNLCLSFGPLANDGYDWVIPITAGASDTSLTVNLQTDGTAQNTGWPLGAATSGSYVIYGCAYVTATNRTQAATATTFTAGDTSGLTAGHTIDQTMAYNQSFQILQGVFNRHIGFSNHGGGIAIVNNGTATSPYMLFGYSWSGKATCAFCIGISGAASGPPLNGLYAITRPTTSWITDTTTTGTSIYDLFQYRDSGGATQHAIQYTPNAAATTPDLQFFGGPAGIDKSGNFHANNSTINGSESVAGTLTAANISSGPFSNQVLDSQFQSVGASAHTWTSSGGGVTFTQNAGLDVFGGNTALEMSGGTGDVLQTTGVSMTAGNTYAASFYAQSASGTPFVFVSLHTSGLNTGCLSGGGPGIPTSFPITTTLTKYTVYCTATVNDTLRVAINGIATSIPIFFSTVQVAGSPWCTTNCTTTGPPAVTTAATISGNGMLANGVTIVPVLLSNLAAQAANSVVANATGGSASPTALVMPTCPSGTGISSSVGWVNGTGFACTQTTFVMPTQQVFTATGSNSPAVLYSFSIPIAKLSTTTAFELREGGSAASGSTHCAFAANIGASSGSAANSGTALTGTVTPGSAGSFVSHSLASNQASPTSSTAILVSAVNTTSTSAAASASGNINETATGCGSTSTVCVNIQITDATNAEVCNLNTAILRVAW